MVVERDKLAPAADDIQIFVQSLATGQTSVYSVPRSTTLEQFAQSTLATNKAIFEFARLLITPDGQHASDYGLQTLSPFMTLQVKSGPILGGSIMNISESSKLIQGQQDLRQVSIMNESHDDTLRQQDDTTLREELIQQAIAMMRTSNRNIDKNSPLYEPDEHLMAQFVQNLPSKGHQDLFQLIWSQISCHFQASSVQDTIEKKIEREVHRLDLLQTFSFILSVTPTKAAQLMSMATIEQIQLLDMVKNAEDQTIITIISDALSRAEHPRDLACLKDQLKLNDGKIADMLCQRLELPCSPFFWSVLSLESLLRLTSINDEALLLRLVKNCSQEQISDLLGHLKSSEQKTKIYTAQMRVAFQLDGENMQNKSLQTVESICDKEKYVSVAKMGRTRTFMRRGSNELQLLEFQEFNIYENVIHLDQDEVLQDPIRRNYQLSLFSLVDKGVRWSLRERTNMQLDTQQEKEPTDQLYPIMSSSTQDVAFIAWGAKFVVGIIHEGTCQIELHEVSPNSHIYKALRVPEQGAIPFKAISFFRDRDGRVLIAYNPDHKQPQVFFYDLKEARTTVQVDSEAQACFYMCHQQSYDLCIFEASSCNIDFRSARQQQDIVRVEPIESDLFKYNLRGSITRQWNKGNKSGFAVFSVDSKVLQILEVHQDGEVELLKEQILGDASPRLIDTALNLWLDGKEFDITTRIVQNRSYVVDNERSPNMLRISQNFAFISKFFEGSIYAYNLWAPQQKQTCMGFTLKNEYIRAFGVMQGAPYPGFIIITENEADSQISLLHVFFKDRKAWNKKENIQVKRQLVSEKCWAQVKEMKDEQWQPLLMEYYSQGPNFVHNFIYYLGRHSVFFIPDPSRAMLWHRSNQPWFVLRPIMLMSVLGEVLFVQFEKSKNADMIMYHHGPIFELSQATVLQAYLRDTRITVLDSNFNLTKITIVKKNDELTYTDKQVWNLQHIDALKETAQFIGHPAKHIQLTDTTVCFNGKIFCLETGHLLEQHPIIGSEIKLDSNLQIVFGKGKLFQDMSWGMKWGMNPGSRELRLGDEEFRRNLLEIHQISQNILLFIRFSGVNRNDREIITLDTSGTFADLPQDFSRAIPKNCELKSYFNYSSGRGQLLVIDRNGQSDGPIHNATVLELTEQGGICSSEKLEIQHQPVLVRQQELLQNKQGCWLQVNVNLVVDEIDESIPPSIIRISNKMSLVVFQEFQRGTNLVYAGDFLCWLQNYHVQVLDLKANSIRQISFASLAGEKANLSKLSVFLDACEPRSLIQAGLVGQLDAESIQKMSNHIQLTLEHHAFILDLNEKSPIHVAEMDKLDQLYDPQNFIETGFKPYKSVSQPLSDSNHYKCLQLSPFMNLVFETIGDQIFVYRRFCKGDINDIKAANGKSFTTKMLWASYKNQSALDLIQEKPRYLKAVSDLIEAQDEDQYESDYHPNLRRLAYLMSLRKVEYNKETKQIEVASLLQKSLKSRNLRDSLLKLGCLSPQFSLTQAFDTQSSFEEISKSMTPQVVEALDNSFVQSGLMRSIQMLDWPEQSSFQFVSDTLMIDHELIQEKLSSENVQRKQVMVESLDLRWFHQQRRNFIYFATLLTNAPSSFYTSKFIVALLDQFWPQTRREIIIKHTLPFLSAYIASITYFIYVLAPDQDDTTLKQVLGGFILLYTAYSFKNEILQLANKERKCDYFTDAWNMFDLSGLLLTLLIVILTLFDIDLISIENLRTIASFASLALSLKLYDWLRLFEQTSFFIILIAQTFEDITWFLILFFVALLSFSIPMSILDLNRNEEQALISSSSGFWLLDGIINQYLLSLGEFASLENVPDNPQSEIALIFFIFATIFTQLTMLNMLISIMSDTYAFVTDNSAKFANKSKLEILISLAPNLRRRDHSQTKETYLILITPADDDQVEQDEWGGSINKIANLVQKNMHLLGQDMKKTIGKMQNEINKVQSINQTEFASIKSDSVMIREESAQIKKESSLIKGKVQGLEAQISNIESMLTQLVTKKERAMIQKFSSDVDVKDF